MWRFQVKPDKYITGRANTNLSIFTPQINIIHPGPLALIRATKLSILGKLRSSLLSKYLSLETKSLTPVPSYEKQKSRITLLYSRFELGTVFNGKMTIPFSKGHEAKGPMMASCDASFCKYFIICPGKARAPAWFFILMDLLNKTFLSSNSISIGKPNFSKSHTKVSQ